MQSKFCLIINVHLHWLFEQYSKSVKCYTIDIQYCIESVTFLIWGQYSKVLSLQKFTKNLCTVCMLSLIVYGEAVISFVSRLILLNRTHFKVEFETLIK